jgi:hypothetical protein
MNFGFDGDLAMFATLIGAITKFIFYPLAQLRRRGDSDGDGQPDDVASGSFYIHPDVQSIVVLIAILIVSVIVSFATGEPLFPLLTSATTGFVGARAAHEGIGAIKK